MNVSNRCLAARNKMGRVITIHWPIRTTATAYRATMAAWIPMPITTTLNSLVPTAAAYRATMAAWIPMPITLTPPPLVTTAAASSVTS
jgi:hypothetical protein